MERKNGEQETERSQVVQQNISTVDISEKALKKW